MASPKKAGSWRSLRWLLLLPIPLCWCVLEHYKSLRFLEEKSIDWRFKRRGEISAPVRIVYVNIDSLSLDPNEIGGFPWSRTYFATVCDALVRHGKVKAVGIDIVLSEAG